MRVLAIGLHYGDQFDCKRKEECKKSNQLRGMQLINKRRKDEPKTVETYTA